MGRGDDSTLNQLEYEKRRAEEDKNAAITALEARSIDYMKEKEEKQKLQEKIQQLTSSLLIGGKQIEEHPQFISALEEK